VPESVPGPNSTSFSSGNDGSTWFQFVTSDFGAQIFSSCSVVRQVAKVFSLFTTTVSASFATVSGAGVTPAFSQFAFSSSSIGREASFMSVSPRQNFSNPPPVPDARGRM